VGDRKPQVRKRETGELPLVSVGLPTYNRARSLRRAIESVLAQDYPNLELIISDNGSPDDTQAVCGEYRARDSRVRYFRHGVNRGVNANFKRALAESRGEFFMWLADDDWLDPTYVSRCAEVLVGHPDHQLVCGRGRYFRGAGFCFDEEEINLLEETAGERVLSYYRRVGMNGAFYGLMRREVANALPLREVLGGDWLFVARLAGRGKVRTLSDAHLNRSIAGVSQDIKTLARREGVSSGFFAHNPHVYIALVVFKDIAWGPAPCVRAGGFARVRLGLKSAAAIIGRYSLPYWSESFDAWQSNLRSRITLRTRLRRLLQRFVYRGQ
jgi:glycosyltransferase involved in cell wall biosynthesis